MRLFLSTIFIVFVFNLHSQNKVNEIVDSLEQELDKVQAVKQKIKTLNVLSFTLLRTDTTKAMKYGKEALKISQEEGYKDGEMAALNFFARFYTERGQLDTALFILKNVVTFKDEVENQKEIADAFVSMGNIYDIKGDYPNALDNYFSAEKIFEELEYWRGVGMANLGIGNIYHATDRFENAIKHYRKSTQILRQINDPYTSWPINNMATSMDELGMTDSAEFYYKKSLQLKKEAGDVYGASYTYSDLGELYFKCGKIKLAKKHFEKALELKQQVEGISKETIGKALLRLGQVALMEKNYQEAINHFNEANLLAKESAAVETLTESYKALSEAYAETGEYQQAFEALDAFTVLQDSLKNAESIEKLAEIQTQYETAEKEAQIDLMKSQDELNKAKIQKAEEESKRNMTMLIGAVIVVLFLLITVFFAYRSNKTRKKVNKMLRIKNEEITCQKELIEEKSTEILDSITYAKRIQSAILPPIKFVQEHLPNSFILYKPKDIVAGDFYWLEYKNGTTLFAAADCTGHGVPGAMVSVICNNGLNRSVREYGLTDPGKILDKTREIVIKEFEKSEEEVKDGMDIALVAIEKEKESEGDLKLKYAGANNALWILRKGSNEVEEVKANKQPIGKGIRKEPFTTNQLKLNKGDQFYLFSDGYADQFGGEKGKKLKAANFKKILLSIKDLPMSEQKSQLDEYFTKWKGNLEQLDDVCVIGVRI